MASDLTIVRAAIHPGIGFARVGNSPDEYLIGPEVPYRTPAPQGGYRDASGALRRQAARFRIYGYNAAGEVVKELTADDAQITWTVHVANKKAAWYRFIMAMDLPGAPASPRRNPGYMGDNRHSLVIDPGARTIAGKNQSGPDYQFNNGQFLGQPVYLGELRTDEAGHLLFLGGHGASSSPLGRPITTYDNNEGWHDDVCDGPVTATLTMDGQAIAVDSAWVVAAPPNYAPDLVSVITLYDLLYDTFQPDWLPLPGRPSFTAHIYPILSQLSEAQWVNFGFHQQFGWGGLYDLFEPGRFARLASNAPANAGERQRFLQMIRNPNDPSQQVQAWPQIYADSSVHGTFVDYRVLMSLTRTQYRFLQQWAHGDFEADWDANAPPLPQRIEDISLADRPATLDKAALHFCMGGPFHPGCEVTWPMRHRTLYSAPFRIRLRQPNQPEPDYGNALTAAALNDPNGPLFLNAPGDITRWMAVPWQTDTADCRNSYPPAPNPYLPTFWPARVPNHVLALENYQQVMNTALLPSQRHAAFQRRAEWVRVLTAGSHIAQLGQMVTLFGYMGLLERRPGPQGDPAFPSVMYVETFASDPLLSLKDEVALPETAIGAPALSSMDGAGVALAWTATNQAHNLCLAQFSDGHSVLDKVVLGDTSIDGPALAYGNGSLFLAWVATNGVHSLCLQSSADGRTFGNKVVLGDTSPYSPALAFGNGRLYLAWAGTDPNHTLCVMSSIDGLNFAGKVVLGETSSAAPGLCFVAGKLYLLWRGNDPNHSLCMLESTDGVNFGNKVVLTDGSDTRPALALADKLYLGWTGRNQARSLCVLSSKTGTSDFAQRVIFDQGSSASPALTGFGGKLLMAWTANDGRGTLKLATIG